ncbi:formin-like protein 12 isoform X1 [Arabidopsis lyrata subsp. lyrata]|uniref:formin-like protein 12 isoform X1 n=1 Tax=Arabidopsis lyrata subsp. lyrata TaxID=81972 RepID=UPI000A29E86F|nr:formin-like protein 12 isoform X1 [Arabidopsis lyrata subsp. lyrata]|eukprot:XP_020869129.1 formin-like protein 12 isoform X1 [Arabidopsis lyrata subsp. lyrata]
MLSKIKIPLPDMLNAVLDLDSSALIIEQIKNLIKICRSKEEMDLLRNSAGGDKEMLGKFEEIFGELMKVPRIEPKLRVFAFKVDYSSRVKDLRIWLNTIIAATKEIMGSVKLLRIMQTISTLEILGGSNAECVLASLVRLSDNVDLMHDFYKLVGEKMPELLDFGKDLVHLEAASKIELNTVAENMQQLYDIEREVDDEFIASENDGANFVGFRNVLYDFLGRIDADAQLLNILYSEAGRIVDSYISEYPTSVSFEEGTITSLFFYCLNYFAVLISTLAIVPICSDQHPEPFRGNVLQVSRGD